MAAASNPNDKAGFRPIVRLGGAPFSTRQYAKDASEPREICTFDMVLKVPNSVPLPEMPSYTLPAIRTGNVGTPGTSLWLGVSLSASRPLTFGIHPVADEADCVFLAQMNNGAPVPSTATTVGKNANILVVAFASATLLSNMAIAPASVAVTATLDLRIRAIAMIGRGLIGGSAGGPQSAGGGPNLESDRALLEVTINKHFFGQGTPGV
jgi:hypothetical protein